VSEYAIDLRFSNNRSGIGRDARYFHSALKCLIPNIVELSTLNQTREKKRMPDYAWFRSQLGFPNQIDTSGTKYLFQPHVWHMQPSISTRRIIRIHDIFPITNPEWFRRTSIRAYTRGFMSIKAQDLILADSEFTANEILNFRDDLKVEVLYCQTPKVADYACDGCQSCENIKLPEKFFLCVNTIEPRKNYPNLIKAWGKVLDDYLDVQLLILGRKGWKCRDEIRLIRRSKSVVWISDACDKVIAEAYSRALFSINPSLGEGFNYPTLESKVFACRTLASNIAVNRELNVDSISFDPLLLEDIAYSISRGLGVLATNPSSFDDVECKFQDDLETILLRNGIL